MPKQIELVWFRNDLRIIDNPALYHACQSGQPVVAIYMATPQQWDIHDDAAVKLDFWRRNLLRLEKDLAKLNIELHFFQVDGYKQAPDLIATICQQWAINQLHFNEELPVNECQRDKEIIERCQDIGVTYQHHHDQLLLPPASIRTKTNTPYKVFTAFSTQARQRLVNPPSLYPAPDPCEKIIVDRLMSQCDLGDIPWPTVSKQMPIFWPAGQEQALSRLVDFCHQPIQDYKAHRDIPSLAGTSHISPYLAAGIVSAGQCWQATLQCEMSDGVLVWQNELLWREFYKHTLIDCPQVSKHKPLKLQTEKIEWRHDEKQLAAWQQGKTGFPIVDAAMRQLLARGWMHNRLRMIVAMFLTKHLLIDWRLGERWFMQHLIDGDLAANNGGWQWCASTGTDSAPYFRIFNPVTQSKRFDPNGTFIRHYVPELAHLSDKDIHLPSNKNKPENYPKPIIDLKLGRLRALSAFKGVKSEKWANTDLECLSHALSCAVRWGTIDRNPAIGQVRKFSTKGRKHKVSNEDLILFAELLPRKWQLYISLKLCTRGRRKGELLRIKLSDCTEDGIEFRNNKNPDDLYLIEWTPQLKSIIHEIESLPPRRIGSAYLFINRHGRPYINEETSETSGFDSMWQRWMKKAKAKGVTHFTENDLRKKAVEGESLQRAQELLRHTTAQTTKKHYSIRDKISTN